jgi:serine/threonine protein kinase
MKISPKSAKMTAMITKNCPQCGKQVFDELPGGMCPVCLMDAARKSQANDDYPATLESQHGFHTPTIGEMSRLFPELEILQMVGRGGMGAVYRVRQKNLDRIVALKVFLYKPNDPEFAARFQREARALAKLNHPNIVTVHDFGMRENMHYLIMEYVDGLNLRQITSEERLSPEMALQMVPQLCDALQYAHDQGVIHRDIKPENLLIDTSGRIKIADFGLAKLTGSNFDGSLTRTQQVMGTLNYMAPEQRERPTEVDHRADIYSLGVVIYEMLTGELPIGRFQPPSSKSSVNNRLDDVVMKALEKEPDLRYQQASEFKTGLESAGEFIPARAPLAPMRPVKSESYVNHSPVGTRYMVSIMAGREKKGNWRPGNPQLVFGLMSGTSLDLTEVQAEQVNIRIFTMMAGTDVIVPRGATVDVDGLIVMGAIEDNVSSRHAGNSRMHVRIQAWGLMAGCEVRTPTVKEVPLERPKQVPGRHAAQRPAIHQFREPPEHGVTVRGGLIAMYRVLAFLICIACPIFFLLVGSNFLLSDNYAKMMGITMAIVGGFAWSAFDYFRRLIGAGPEDPTDAEQVANYYASTWLGTLIRTIALAAGFACPILFVISSFEDIKPLRFTAILCAVMCGVLYAVAGYVEDTLYGKRRDVE